MKQCRDCGMPMLAPEDFAHGDTAEDVCVNCGQKYQMAGMVVSFGVFTSRLGKADEVLEFLEKSLRQARALSGLVDAYIAQSRENPGQFFTYSKWKDMESYDAMQAAFEITEMQQSFADIIHLLECEPVMGSFQIVE